MAAEDASLGAGATGEQNSTMSEPSGAALLLVLGDPFTVDHKELILERIIKGLKSWDVETTGCDLNTELSSVAASAPSGEPGANDEHLIHHSTENLQLDVLVNPQLQTCCNKIQAFLLHPTKHRQLVFGGHAVQGSGDWILQDDILTFDKFASICRESDVENALKQNEGGTLNIATFDEGPWNNGHLGKLNIGKILDVKVNPEEKISDCNGIDQFSSYVGGFLKPKSVKDLLQSSDVVGNIRFSRPTLYVFPGSQGDSALFGISGFNLLVNGGYNRKASFWDFTRHLDRIDAVLLTHLGIDNLFGISTVLERKAQENVHPEIGYVYMNAVDKLKHSPNGDTQPENGGSHKPTSLLVNLVEEGNKLMENLTQLGQTPHPCVGKISASSIEPINLYHKVGHGSLDMYVLNPVQESKELKEFFSQWNKNVDSFSSSKSVLKVGGKDAPVPLPSMCSVSALLVWRPSQINESITRILFPGSAPQHKIFEGLDKLKNENIFQHETCSEQSLQPAPKVKKAPAAKPGAKAKPGTPPPSARAPKKVAEKKPLRSTQPKTTKEEKNTKKAAASKKSSATTTPSDTKSRTPVETPTAASPAATPEQNSPTPELPPEPEIKAEAQPVVAKEPELAAPEPKEPEPQPEPEIAVKAEPIEAPAEPVPEPKAEPDVNSEVLDPSDVKLETAGMIEKEISDVQKDEMYNEKDLSDIPPNQAAFEAPESVPEPSVEDPVPEGHGGFQPEKAEIKQEQVAPVQSAMPEADQPALDSPEPLPDPAQFDAAPLDATEFPHPDIPPVIDAKPFDEKSPAVEQKADLFGSEPSPPPQENESQFPLESVMATNSESAPAEAFERTDADKTLVQEDPFSPSPQIADPYDPASTLESGGDIPSGVQLKEPLVPASPVESEEKMPQDLAFDELLMPVSSEQKPSGPLFDEPIVPASPVEPEALPIDSDIQAEEHQDVHTAPNLEQESAPEADDFPVEVTTDAAAKPDLLADALLEPQTQGEQESAFPQTNGVMSRSMMDDLGIYDEQPEDVQGQKALYEPMEPLVPSAAGAAEEGLNAPGGVDPQDLPEDQQLSDKAMPDHPAPEADQVFGGASPEGLPEPEFSDLRHDDIMAEPDVLDPSEIKDIGSSMPVADVASGSDVTDESIPQASSPELDTPLMPTEEAKQPDLIPETDNWHPERSQESFDPYCQPLPEHYLSSSPPETPDESQTEQSVTDQVSQPLTPDNEPLVMSPEPEPMSQDSASQEPAPLSPEAVSHGTESGSHELEPPLSPEPMSQGSESVSQEPEFVPDEVPECLLQEPEPMPQAEEFIPDPKYHGLSDDYCDESQEPLSLPDSLGEDREDNLMPADKENGNSLGLMDEPLLPEEKPSSPLELLDGPQHCPSAEKATNPFLGVSGEELFQHQSMPGIPVNGDSPENTVNPFDFPEDHLAQIKKDDSVHERDSLEKEGFDPLKEWDHPMGLPAPPPPGGESPASKKPTAGAKKDVTKKPPAKKATDVKKTATGTSAAKRPTSAASLKSAATRTTKKESSVERTAKKTDRLGTPKKNSSSEKLKNGTTKEPAKKPGLGAAAKKSARPATAPVAAKAQTPKKAPAGKRPATSTAAKSAQAKAAPLAPVVPFYVDLTYVPHHGNSHYVDMTFFRRIRARYYVISALNPNPSVLNALLEAKMTWENPDVETTIIPTYDTETLRYWMGLHRDQLSQYKISVAPSASRCTIQLQDHETSCAAYRLEF